VNQHRIVGDLLCG